MLSDEKKRKYMEIVKFQSNLLSKDNSTKVGALFLCPNTNVVLSMGYNGMPRGIAEEDPKRWEKPTKDMYVEHAERNAIYNACRKGTCLEGSICIVSMFPCCDCARGLIQSGVHQLVTYPPKEGRWKDNCNTAKELILEAGIDLILL